MASWTDGYVTELDYTHGFYREEAPSWLNYGAMCQSMRSPALDRPFHYCELGCGQGYTTNLLAAANPLGQFYATDFNPSHIHQARTLAQAAALENVRFFDLDFQAFDRLDLPDFDFIALHGIYSWVSPSCRQQIVDFLAHHLKVGGLVYLSYNALPGWSRLQPLREVMSASVAASNGTLTQKIDEAIALLDRLIEHKALCFANNPDAISWVGNLKQLSRNYLAHEYFNTYWQPFHYREVAQDLDRAKLTFMGSATLAEQMHRFCLQPEQLETYGQTGDPILRETLKDAYLNTMFRRDVFVRGASALNGPQQLQQLNQLGFALTAPIAAIPKERKFQAVTVKLDTEPFVGLAAALQERSLTFAELHQRLPQVPIADLNLSLAIAIDGGWIQPCLPGVADGSAARRFNRVVWEQAALNAPLSHVAVPLTGNAIALDRTGQLFLRALDLERSPTQYALEVYQSQGLRLMKDDRPVENEADALAILDAEWDRFDQGVLPLLRSLQVL